MRQQLRDVPQARRPTPASMQIAWTSVLATRAIAGAYSWRLFCLPHLQPVFGIQSLRSTSRCLERQSVPIGNLVKKWIRSRQVVGNDVRRFGDLRNIFADILAHLLSWIEKPGLTSHQRFCQEGWIGNNRCDGQIVSVPNPMLSEGSLVASRNAVAAQITFLEVRGVDVQHVAVPRAGG